jgi:hypothetical protein
MTGRTVEAHGFRVLHALTDSLWIEKRGTKDSEYDEVICQIERVTNLPLALEGIFKWVAFLPSRVDARRSVPTRYFGAMDDGEIKIRGNRSDRVDHSSSQWVESRRGRAAELACRDSSLRHSGDSGRPRLSGEPSRPPPRADCFPASRTCEAPAATC